MSDTRPSFVLGFHGCEASVAERVLAGEGLKPSAEDYDWLGPGIYFWEGDARRAREWAEAKVKRGAYAQGAVVGAVVDLGHCLDLTTRDDLELLGDAYLSFEQACAAGSLEMPQNRGGDDLVQRFLDCAVIKHLHENIEAEATKAADEGRTPLVRPFDSVRGLFTEGKALYPGGGFRAFTHAQIAVRDERCIKGVFRLRPT